jgi:hypothetical protein
MEARWFRAGCVLLALGPPIALAVCVYLYGLDLPLLDQWEIVPLFDKLRAGSLRFEDLWAQHNEHRLVVPRAIMLVLGQASGWNIRWELACNVLLGTGIFAVLVTFVRPRRLWAIAVLSAMVFSLTAEENWFWGWQLQIFANVLLVAGSTALLSRSRLSVATGVSAFLLGGLSLLCFANGIVFLLLGPVLILVMHRGARWALMMWIVGSGLLLALYLKGYRPNAKHPAVREALSHPLQFVHYVLAWLGSPVAGFRGTTTSALAGALGIAGLGALVARLRRAGESVSGLSPPLALAAYAIGSAILVALGRSGFGVDQALAPRYRTIAGLLWIAVLLLLARVREAGWRFRGLAAALFVVVTMAGLKGASTARWNYFARRDLREMLLKGDSSRYVELYPDTAIVVQRCQTLELLRMSVFRDR